MTLEKESSAKGILKSLGLVFGDIGTSPIYTLTVIFLILPVNEANIRGILSLIFWTLILLVTAQYAWLAMSLSKKGEGGTIVLKEILVPLLKKGRRTRVVLLLSYVGVSLLVGDGVLTPAISILSAVEGIRIIPAFSGISISVVLAISAVIAVALFSVQSRGTEKVSSIFGPVMVVWFSALAVSGIASIAESPSILLSFNPYYAVRFFLNNGLTGFFILSEVILCATGGEALYADMGHLGRRPIVQAWAFVFVALVLNYYGQGQFMLSHGEQENALFSMILHQAALLYVPFLLLTVVATIIASQAMISGMFSLTYQAINTGILPRLQVDYTSGDRKSQIYISTVNWMLLVGVVIVMFLFKQSTSLAVAYGLAVTGTMCLTALFLSLIFYLRKSYFESFVSMGIGLVNIAFFLANGYKIPHGGYISIIISLIPLVVILLYTNGQRRVYRELKPMPLSEFLPVFKKEHWVRRRIEGTALFLLRDPAFVPPYITRTMFQNGIIYDDNIFVIIAVRDDPFGVTAFFKEDLSKGLRVFEIQMGYMERVDIEGELLQSGIREQAIFYGLEDIAAARPWWKAFAVIKKVTPNIVQFYKLPHEKVHGIVTRVEI